MESSRTYFTLYANCIAVTGAARAIICDLQIGSYAIIPNFIYQYLLKSSTICLEDAKIVYGEQFEEIQNYLYHLENYGLGFWCTDPALFPKIDFTWDTPSLITNCIIDIDYRSQHNYAELFKDLDELGCVAVQLRSYSSISLLFYENILKATELTGFTSIELVIKYEETFNEDELIKFCINHRRIKNLIIHSSPFNKQLEVEPKGLCILLFVKDELNSNSHCGVITLNSFTVNMGFFSESLNFNSCLNRKVGIDVNGEIKNCPSLKESFGNISRNSIKQIVQQKNFTMLWNIKKDQIEICKDCEFRYICSDCRAYQENDGDVFAKPKKCSYNPYTTIWADKE